jgi:hypothetical protein
MQSSFKDQRSTRSRRLENLAYTYLNWEDVDKTVLKKAYRGFCIAYEEVEYLTLP